MTAVSVTFTFNSADEAEAFLGQLSDPENGAKDVTGSSAGKKASSKKTTAKKTGRKKASSRKASDDGPTLDDIRKVLNEIINHENGTAKTAQALVSPYAKKISDVADSDCAALMRDAKAKLAELNGGEEEEEEEEEGSGFLD